MELKFLAQELRMELENNLSPKSNLFEQCNFAIVLCRNLLVDFKKGIAEKRLNNIVAVIDFFKNIKQIPFSNLVFLMINYGIGFQFVSVAFFNLYFGLVR